MDVFDLLDRETRRFTRDFHDCAAQPDDAGRHAAGEPLLRRIATYLLALEDVIYPSLVAAEIGIPPSALQAHERLRRRTAEALLRYCGREASAYRSLCRVRHDLKQYVELMRRELYPAMYRTLSVAESLMLADELLQWLAAHRRQQEGGMAAPPGRPWAPSRPPGLDLDRLPTLHHVVAQAQAELRGPGRPR